MGHVFSLSIKDSKRLKTRNQINLQGWMQCLETNKMGRSTKMSSLLLKKKHSCQMPLNPMIIEGNERHEKTERRWYKYRWWKYIVSYGSFLTLRSLWVCPLEGTGQMFMEILLRRNLSQHLSLRSREVLSCLNADKI